MNIVTLEIIERLEKSIVYRKDIAHRKITFRIVWESKYLSIPINKIHPLKVIEVCENDFIMQTIHDFDISQKQSSSIPEDYQTPIYGDEFYYKYLSRRPMSEYEMSDLIENYFGKKYEGKHLLLIDTNSNEKVSIINFDTLKIKTYQNEDLIKRSQFCLIGGNTRTKYVELTPSQGSFLMYLSMERKEKGKDWLIHPEEHKKELDDIYKTLELDDDYYDEIYNKPVNPNSWIWNYKNTNRKSIVHNIHKNLRLSNQIRGTLIKSRKGTPSRKGNYSLAECIKAIQM